MAAEYDYKNIKRYIQMHSDLIDVVYLGMKEDLYCTSECIYKDGRFLVDLDEEPQIGGIKGSGWATPCMEVTMKEGSTFIKDAYIGTVIGGIPEWFTINTNNNENLLSLLTGDTE